MGDREARPEWDMWSCDPRRFTAFAAEPDYAVARAWRSTATNMRSTSRAMPGRRRAAASCRSSHDRIAALGAEFNAYHGRERATWYARPRRRHFKKSTLAFRARQSLGKACARGMLGGARCGRYPRPAGLLAFFACMGRARTAWLSTNGRRPGAETRQDRSWLLRR